MIIENTHHVRAHEGKRTAVRVNHPGRRPIAANLRREEIILAPAEDITGLKPVGEEVTEILEYKQGEIFVKKYIRPEYIKPVSYTHLDVYKRQILFYK